MSPANKTTLSILVVLSSNPVLECGQPNILTQIPVDIMADCLIRLLFHANVTGEPWVLVTVETPSL